MFVDQITAWKHSTKMRILLTTKHLGAVYSFRAFHAHRQLQTEQIGKYMWSDNRYRKLEQNVKTLITCKINTDFSCYGFTRKYNQTKTSWRKYCPEKIMIGRMCKFTSA